MVQMVLVVWMVRKESPVVVAEVATLEEVVLRETLDLQDVADLMEQMVHVVWTDLMALKVHLDPEEEMVRLFSKENRLDVLIVFLTHYPWFLVASDCSR